MKWRLFRWFMAVVITLCFLEVLLIPVPQTHAWVLLTGQMTVGWIGVRCWYDALFN